MDTTTESLQKLDAFDPGIRRSAFRARVRCAGTAPAPPIPACPAVNLHAHTFFSYNAQGFSPTRLAWEAHRAGLEAAGIVDFDVLDGLDEFYAAARLLGLRACVGMETRVFVPALSADVINSPGEPGIAYHMGLGFPHAELDAKGAAFVDRLRTLARERNIARVNRVNDYLSPAVLDYADDVLSLTPGGNATERHICLAYARKAAERFPGRAELAAFWRDRLDAGTEGLGLPEGPDLQALIRARTMKRGGVGYVPPDRGSFPELSEMNRAVRAMGALPTVTWLDGSSDGERDPDALLRMHRKAGAAVLNIIPDRNFTPGVRDAKLACLQAVVACAREQDMPMVGGTEMNAPGQRFVDDFSAPELAPLADDFLRGARLACAHAVLQTASGMGYLSEWADTTLPGLAERNRFFEKLGRSYDPAHPDALRDARSDMTPREVLALAERHPHPDGIHRNPGANPNESSMP